MPTVADALRQHAPAYLDKYGDRVPLMHRKVLMAIMRCRTGELGSLVYQCKSCSAGHWVGRSCGNRHCPNCQKEKTQDWLDAQTQKLLPVQHFVVTITVPQELRPLLRSNQKAGYDAIFSGGSETIRTLLGNDKNLGSDKTGFFGVLHTWGRDPIRLEGEGWRLEVLCRPKNGSIHSTLCKSQPPMNSVPRNNRCSNNLTDLPKKSGTQLHVLNHTQ